MAVKTSRRTRSAPRPIRLQCVCGGHGRRRRHGRTSASPGDDKIAWYENDGSQIFAPHTISTTADAARSVFAADVDGDGITDVLSASQNDNTIAWYRQLPADLGDAPLPYPTTLAEGGARHAVTGLTLGATRDGEADGTHSMAADADGADEDGVTFGTIQVGALDAIVTVNVQGGAGKLDAWIDFNGDGSWGGPGEQVFVSRDVAVGDNLLMFDVSNYALAGTTYARFRLSSAGGLGVTGAAVDGEVEDYQVTIGNPAASGGFFPIQNTISEAAAGAQSVFAADLDGDGDTDVLSASKDDNKIAWYENDGSGNFSTPEHEISTWAVGAHSVLAADLDGDGHTDVLSGSFGDNTIAWYQNDGHGIFSFAAPISVFAWGVRSVFTADMDDDGDTDVVAALYANDEIAWYENDGSGIFTYHSITGTADGAHSVFAADVDGDGDIDVLSASRGGKITWYENDGREQFTDHTISTSAKLASTVFATDVDGDGDTDVLSASVYDNTIAWYENDGSETFTTHNISTTALGAFSVFAADVDGDGDTDVLGASYEGDKITWYENDGSQRFTPRTVSTSADGAHAVFAADVDGDGDLDVLSASKEDNKIAWYENLGGDFGDAPAPYPTTAADDGASHRPTGLTLGPERDVEADGTHSTAADADGSDEDGVVIGAIHVGALEATVTVNVQGAAGKLDAWIDFDGDGSWSGVGEQVFVSRDVAMGDNPLVFTVPGSAIEGTTYARFRLSTAGGLLVTGLASDGEVEDYQLTIQPEVVVPPEVVAVVIDDGTSQRSRVRSLTVTFNTEVTLDDDAFSLEVLGGAFVDLIVTSTPMGGTTKAEITFVGSEIVGDSLADGDYLFTVHHDRVHSGSQTMSADHVESFFRYFGDVTGDRVVGLVDFNSFRSTFGKTTTDPVFESAFDWFGDGVIGLDDFNQLRARFGKRL